MNIAIIGSTSLRDRMANHVTSLEKSGHTVRMPFFDDTAEMNELQLSQANLANIKWADRVDILWDQRSPGTILDFGFVIALGKPIELVYLEPKTLTGIIRQYRLECDRKGERG